LLLIASISAGWLSFCHRNIREFNMIEDAVMNQCVAKRYGKGYVLRFGLLGLIGIVSFLILFHAPAANALQATLAWDPPVTGTVGGYKVYYKGGGSGAPYDGTDSYQGDSPIDVGSVTTYTIDGLDALQSHCFVVTSYNQSGESTYSNEACTAASESPSSPTISLAPTSLLASCTQGSNATAQSLQIWNSGGGTLSYAISDNASWLSCGPTTGTSIGEQDTIKVTYATSQLAAGTYSATITFTDSSANNSPETILVVLVVSAPSSSGTTSGATRGTTRGATRGMKTGHKK
jgi:hypothetical protein